MKTPDEQIYTELKKIVIRKGLTIEKLADKIGMTPNGLKIAFEKRTLKMETAIKITKALDMPFQALFGMEGKDMVKEPLDDYREGFRDKYLEALEEIRDLNKRYQDKCKQYEEMCRKYEQLCDHLKDMGVDPEKIKQTTS